MLVAALAGQGRRTPRAHVDSGVDIVVAQGYEAGGHTGEIASMVLVPEIVDAVGDRVPVLAAGGIGCGRQVAAALALGAAGVWMGSCWLTTAEYAARHAGRRCSEALLARRLGRHRPVADLLRQAGPAAEEPVDARRGPSRTRPEPLPMPLQNLLVSEAHQRLMRGPATRTSWRCRSGRSSGRMNEVRPVAEVMAGLVAEVEEARARLET